MQTSHAAHWDWPDHLPFNIRRALTHLEELYSTSDVNQAIDRMAVRMTAALQDQDPVLVSVMQGGAMLQGRLLPRLGFPVRCGYVHASRYGDDVTPGTLNFYGHNVPYLDGAHVVFVDDILDAGQTLQALMQWAQEQGAVTVEAAVLVQRLGVSQPVSARYVGLTAEPGFLVGCGMDLAGYGRNLPALYRVPDAYLP